MRYITIMPLFLYLSICKVSCPRVTMSFMALHFVFHFCAVRALILTPHSLCYRILFSKLAVQHGQWHKSDGISTAL